jgi:hypothetical protein
MSVAAVGGYIYAVGGNTSNGEKSYRYDPSTNTWTPIADVPFTTLGKGSSQVVDIQGRPVTISSGLNQVAAYNPASNTWSVYPTTLNAPPDQQWAFAATTANK